MKLIIAEKKELAEDIAVALDKKYKKFNNYFETQDYSIVWSNGHILRLKEPQEIDEKYKEWNFEDLPLFFPKWEKSVIEEKKFIFSNIKSFLTKADEIIHAGDPDDEGQYLIDEILEFCNFKKPVKRVLINDGNSEAVKKAFSKLEDNQKYLPLGKAAEARAISDALVGYNLSRYYTLSNTTNQTLTIGRVQTPTLALVVRRDNEIKNHIKEKYFDLYINTKINEVNLKLKYQNPKKEFLKEKEEIINILKKIVNKTSTITIEKKQVYESTPLPFSLTELQSEASRKLGYDSLKTLQITQNLRDKYKAITYNRTDSQYVPEEYFKEAHLLLPIILKKLSLEYLKPDFSEDNKSRCFNNKYVTPHFAIIPTFNEDYENFSVEEKNIYNLIAKRYIIQFLDKKKVEKLEINLRIEDELFRFTSIRTIEKGYTVIYSSEEKEEKKDNTFKLPEGSYNIKISKNDLAIEEKETKPKRPYTEDSLILDMKSIAKYVNNPKIKEILKKKDEGKEGLNGSIGTPATTATIIAELFKRGYLIREGRNIVSSDFAKEYLNILPENLKSPDTTAIWWLLQEEIKSGKEKKEILINYVLDEIKKIIKNKIKITIGENKNKKESLGKCLKCGSDIFEGEKFYYCSSYKEKNCNFKISKTMKVYNNDVTVSIDNVKNLLLGKEILIKKLKSIKNDKIYNAYFTLEINDKYVNLKFKRFEEKKLKKKFKF